MYEALGSISKGERVRERENENGAFMFSVEYQI
jgi:hypothetical protein